MLLFGIFILVVILGIPVGFAFIVSGLIYLVQFTTVNPNIVASSTFSGIDSFSLLAIPLFMFAGDIMRYGGVSKRLINLAKALFKKSVSALGTITVVACAFFGAISGSSAATVAAIGGLMIPEMKKFGYKAEYATALAAASGYLGILIPPSVPIVIYCVTAGASIGQMFIAGIVPGVIAAVGFIICNALNVRKYYVAPANQGEEESSSEKVNLGKAFLEAVPGLLMPVIILGGIYGGVFTATEAAAVSIVYGLLVSILIYKEFKIKDIPNIAKESAVGSGKVLFIVAFAGFFGRLLTFENIPAQMATAILSVSSNKWIVMLLINLILLVMGMLMDMSVSIIVLTPIMLPIAMQLGFNPLHFGMIMIFNLAIGLITPPMALNLFVAAPIGDVGMSKMVKPVLPFVAFSMLVLLIIVFVPQVSTALPALLGY